MQKNWIGKSEGTAITFKVVDSSESFNVFTTRVDTLYGVTYAVLAPEHPLVKVLVSAAESKEVSEYVEKSARKSDLERSELAKDKTGVFSWCLCSPSVNWRTYSALCRRLRLRKLWRRSGYGSSGA